MSNAIPFSRTRKTPLAPDVEKALPVNLDAERSILGAIILDGKVLKDIAGELHVEDFFLDQHRRIFRAMLDLAAEQVVAGRSEFSIDLVMLNEYLANHNQLEAAGGAPYLAALSDGMPRISNVKHYAEIIQNKARLRELIHKTYDLQQRALEQEESVEQLLANADSMIKEISCRRQDNPAVIVGFRSLLNRECRPVEFAIEPLLSSRGTGEIFAWRGTGKSYVTTQMAVDIAKGREVMFGGHRGAGGHWPISRGYRVLYVYGEMDDSEIKERSQAIASMCGPDGIPSDEQLGTMCKDYQANWRPKISTPRDRKFIEDRIFTYGYEGLILDNISTLWPTSAEKQTDRSAELAEWFTDLNQRGVWVIFLHHAGKSGEQRGDSEKEDMLSFVLKLRRPANYKPEEQLRVEVHVEKNRHKCSSPRMLMPFEIQLVRNGKGEPEWITRPAKEAQLEAAFAMFKDGMPPLFIAQEVGVSKATIYRYKAMYDENKSAEFHRESAENE